jgi:hypothetical protein
MIFKRNVPGWERGLRAACGITLLVVAAMMPLTGWPLWAELAAVRDCWSRRWRGSARPVRSSDGGSRERLRPHRRRAGGGREGRRRGGT